MILVARTSQKTQDTTVRCIKTPWVQETRASGQKSQENPKKVRLFGASCNYSRR
ncbi:hypothetical protein Hanom_Chr00s015233g01754491 [Helianthus anomalus]